jgi:hypothetical protein
MAGAAVVEAGVGQGNGNVESAGTASGARVAPKAAPRYASDDEILGLGVRTRTRNLQEARREVDDIFEEVFGQAANGDARDDESSGDQGAAAEDFREAFEANPELKSAWDAANAYREVFATPEDARSAQAQVADLNAMDALFFSKRPEDHAELAKMVAKLDPEAFASLAKAMNSVTRSTSRVEEARQPGTEAPAKKAEPTDERAAEREATTGPESTGASQAQREFFSSANTEAVRGVVKAIETQVERLLPSSVSSEARNRVVGEIYRELDASLQANGQFAKQIRGALRSGSMDAAHHNAVVSLIVSRARQALPSVAKRVLNEWTSTILAATEDRRSRQKTAERRVDIDGSRGGASEGHRIRSPRDIDYGRMSDADILNL